MENLRANELRIGNLVLLTKDNFITTKVYELSGIDIYKLDESDCEDIKPIPLTEEWLEKLGFKDINNKSFKLLKHIHHDIMFRIFDGGAISYCEKNEYVLVKSVHHIQNLFYCLCGEELTIKE